MDKIVEQLPTSAAIGLFKSTEQIRGTIVKDTIGPRFWDRKANFRALAFSKLGNKIAGRTAGIAFGMAINITKDELGAGTSFSRGARATSFQFTKTGKVSKRGRKEISVGRSAGWSRVLELFPFMATRRPIGSQKVWAHKQDGLRKTLQAGSRNRKRFFGNVNRGITMPKGAIAVGYLSSPKDYAEKLEKKYRWAFPTANAHVQSGKTAKNIDRQIILDIKRRKKELGT